MRAKIAASDMGPPFLGLGPKAAIDCKDNENNQCDYCLIEPEDSDQKIERCDSGQNHNQPNQEQETFTHKFPRLL